MFLKPTKIITTLLLLVACTGCPDQTETQTEVTKATGPKTFSEAAEQLVAMKNTIREGFAAADIDSAHGPLHEVGNLLDNLAALAQQADITPQQLEAVEQAKETLFDAFGNIDKTLHGGEGSTYEDEAEVIQAAMQVIVGAAGVTDDSTAAPNLPAADDGLPSGGANTVEAGTVSGDTDDDDQ